MIFRYVELLPLFNLSKEKDQDFKSDLSIEFKR